MQISSYNFNLRAATPDDVTERSTFNKRITFQPMFLAAVKNYFGCSYMSMRLLMCVCARVKPNRAITVLLLM